MLIRVLLLGSLAFIGYRFFLRRHKLPIHIVVLFAFLGVGALMVVFPESTNDLAHWVGVGRGADLITYLALVSVLFVLLHYYTKFVELDGQVTRLTRELAFLRAELDAARARPAAEVPPPPGG
jgi:hypothetical protein